MEDRKPDGYWKNFEIVKKEVKKLMKKHGLKQMPSHTVLGELGYSSLSAAISKYHGGFRRLRKNMGQEQDFGSYIL